MAIWPFNRKKQQADNTLPQEVQEFYESGQKQRKGVAWLLALATLVVTVILAMALFFGGRWIYQNLAANDTPEEQTTQPADNQDGLSGGQLENPSDTPAPTPNDQQDNSSTNTTEPAPQQPSTPTTGSTDPEIPSTGPGPGGLQ